MKVRHACDQYVSAYVREVRQHFGDMDECMQLKDGSPAILFHVHALVMIRGLSNVGRHVQAKQCVINAFDTDLILATHKVMGNNIHKG
jgi:hypothetical protein